MRIPLEITFRHMDASPALEARIREKAEKLDRFHENVMALKVAVEAPHEHKTQGKLFQVRIDMTVPGGELVVTKGHHHQSQAHEDVYVALRDAFDVAKRRLEEYSRQQRGDVKSHSKPQAPAAVEE
ncbi:MAG: ribosome-associated translation inhibitor RaiA [Thiobacillus sp.]|nr:ribosome-associated translation inhibitor RaiA [Thiobacillus sp.]